MHRIDSCCRGSRGRLRQCSWKWNSLMPLALGSRGQPFLIVLTVCGVPPAHWLSPGWNISLCTDRWDSCTKTEWNVLWQGGDTLHWTFEMTQRFNLHQALLLNIYQLSVRVLFSISSTLHRAAATAYGFLRIKTPVMQHLSFCFGCHWKQYKALLIQNTRKCSLCISICYQAT